MAAYERAVVGEMPDRGPKLRGAPGTFDRLTQDYLAGPEFLSLAESTKRTYRSVIERLIRNENIGHRLVREMTREHVRRIIAKRSDAQACCQQCPPKTQGADPFRYRQRLAAR